MRTGPRWSAWGCLYGTMRYAFGGAEDRAERFDKKDIPIIIRARTRELRLVTNLNLLTRKEAAGMYRGRYFIRESVYVCGDYMDADIYPVFQPAGKRRARCKPTSAIQEKLNQKNAEKKITRLAHANFTEDDIALHLTYDELPEDEEQAQRDLYNYIRRVKRLRKKMGLPPLKYLSCTEVGKKSGRIHHHIIMSGGVDRDTLEKLWGKGYANSKRLQFKEDGITGLTRYVAKDHLFYKRWNQSKNLVRPEPVVRDSAVTMDDLEEMEDAIEKKAAWQYFEGRYEGFTLTEATFTRNNINRGCYVNIEMRRRR